MKLNWTNIKYELAGSRGEYQLEPLTAFVGPPGVGKSTILRAVRLAMLRDLNVLNGRSAADYLSMDRDGIFAELSGTVGKHDARVSWRAANQGGRVGPSTGGVSPQKFKPEQWVPALQPIRKLRGAALTRLIADRFAPPGIVMEDTEFADRFAELTAELNKSRSERDQLAPGSTLAATAVMAHCDTEIRSLGRQKGAAKRVGDAQKEVLDPRQIESQLREKRREKKDAEKGLKRLPKLVDVREEIAGLEAKNVELGTKIIKAKERIADVAGEVVVCSKCEQPRVKSPERLAKLEETREKLEARWHKNEEKLVIRRARERVIQKTGSVKIDCLADDIKTLEIQLETAKQARTVAKVAVRDYEREQRRLKELREELSSAMDEVITSALNAARINVEGRMFAGFTPVLRMSPLAWGVESRGAGRYGSASGSQGAVLEIALQLAFAKPNRPPLILLDDEDFTHLSKQQSADYLRLLKSQQVEGRVSQVIVARPKDRIDDIPSSYKVINV